MSMQQCNNFEKVFNTSLLRNNETVTDLVGLKTEIGMVMQRLATTKSELATTLKVFLIGEVKAGKSTLINALVGQKISPTAITESTATIWEIGYAEQPSTTILYKDGQEEVINHADIMSLSGTDKEKLELAERISKIVVKTDQHQFRELMLVDSPGLETITAQNAELTKNIMQEVDLALWVFNGNHPGQTNVMEQVAELAKLGKPIIAVINKIDEVDDSPENLIDYWDEHSGEYFHKIFAVSAFDAFNKKQDSEFSDYFSEFKQYLLDQVSEKALEVKSDSVQASLNALIGTEKVLHESAARTLNQLQQEQRDYADELKYEKDRLADDTRIMIERSCQDLFHDIDLNEKIRYALKPEPNSPFASIMKIVGGSNPNVLEKALAEDISPLDKIAQDYLHIINEKVSAHYKSRYVDIIGVANQKMVARMDDFQRKEQLNISSHLQFFGTATWEGESIDIVETVKTGAIVSAAGGTALAGYAAVFGAHAAAVTMGAAMATVALPIVAVGTVAAGAYAIWKKISNQQKEAEALNTQVQQVQSQLVEGIKESLLNTYASRIGNDFHIVEKENEKLLFAGLEKSQLRQSQNEIENYTASLNAV